MATPPQGPYPGLSPQLAHVEEAPYAYGQPQPMMLNAHQIDYSPVPISSESPETSPMNHYPGGHEASRLIPRNETGNSPEHHVFNDPNGPEAKKFE